jgi:hypothetical protein
MFEVRLINKETGKVHCIDDHPVIITTEFPGYVADELLRNRNLDKWSIEIRELRS